MAAKLKVDQIESVDGSANVTLNNSITMASGKTLPAASLTGTLPAINGASLTGIDALPTQTSHNGKFLTTNGTAASWAVLDTDANSTSKGLYEHANSISANYSITSGNNALTAGPISINSGITVTIPSGSTWVIS